MNKNLVLTLALGIISFSSASFAQKDPRSVITKPRPVEMQSEFKPHVGLLMGVSQPEGSGQESGNIGVDVGYQIYVPFSVGAEFIHSRVDDGNDITDRDTVWLKSAYNLGGTIPVINHSYVGVALGAAFRPDGTSPAIAPLVGFDIPVAQLAEGSLSLGANARYAIVADGQLDTFSLNGVVKYWF